MSKNLRIAVLRGGTGDDYTLSMRTGTRVLKALNELGYLTRDVTVSKNNELIEEGRVKNINLILEGIDIVFLGMNGQLAESGQLQRMLQQKKIRFNGSSSLTSAIAYNKKLTKDTLSAQGILTPKYCIVPKNTPTNEIDIIFERAQEFGPNYIIKPVFGSSSIDSAVAFGDDELNEKIKTLIDSSVDWLIEELISGREVTTAILEEFRDSSKYVFPITEIKLDSRYPYSTYEAKINGHISLQPTKLSYTKKNELTLLTEKIHTLLNLSQYSRLDFIVDEEGSIYFLEANTLPGLSDFCMYPKIIEEVGLSYNQFIDHLLKTATN